MIKYFSNSINNKSLYHAFMAGMSETAIASGRLAKAGGFAFKFAPLWELFGRAFETEVALRRPFLWLPVAAGTGVVLYLYADREPSLWLIAPAAVAARRPRLSCAGERGSRFAVSAGFARSSPANCRRPCGRRGSRRRSSTRSGSLRCKALSRRWTFAATGARFLLRVHSAEGLAPEQTPYRVRLTMRRAPPFEAGTYVSLKARLLPPAHASLPGGYDFARDAWFARLGAVGNVLGRIEIVPSPDPAGSRPRR